MSEIVDKKRRERKSAQPVPVETGPIDAQTMVLDMFNATEIDRLLRVKQAVAEGRYSDITFEHRKLLFVQWLVEHGRLTS